MIRNPKFKICKRIGDEVFPQCQTPRFAKSLARQSTKSKKFSRKSKSEYAGQFKEKQKVRFMYGTTERQFKNYVDKAISNKKINTVLGLVQGLETRIDNVVFRMGLANTRAFARQIVAHGHIALNDKGMNVPSCKLGVGDVISIKKTSAGKAIFKDVLLKLKNGKAPKWIRIDADKMAGEIISLPGKDDVDPGLNLSAVVEFYSRT